MMPAGPPWAKAATTGPLTLQGFDGRDRLVVMDAAEQSYRRAGSGFAPAATGTDLGTEPTGCYRARYSAGRVFLENDTE